MYPSSGSGGMFGSKRKELLAPEVSPYFAPQQDWDRIRFLQQQQAAPAVRKLRKGLLSTLQTARRAENPNVQGLIGREALSGYGEGLESAMAGAGGEAQRMYAPEYSADVQAGLLNWQADERRKLLDYEMAQKEYFFDKERRAREGFNRKEPTHTLRNMPFSTSTLGQDLSGGGQITRVANNAPPSVNPQFWASWEDQQVGIRRAEETGRPISDFYTGTAGASGFSEFLSRIPSYGG
ncbi:hypothetical protein [Candidatus Magnetobacterium casense]|uniref:Flagellar associated protein n=1 Tax=Candidatus Magnetobacterium casense TaxID=1455061 RepID=A0ABS6RUY6_9BACT|nr:hypothetical protein [Candidatus Magnetobacterium casensis]MBV6340444.1 hypothetical protein [Candidatus Magnetobacterium casensis]